MQEVMRWEYCNKKGETFGEVRRYEEMIGDQIRKSTIPYFKTDGQAGIPEGMPASHKLYGLNTVLDNSKPVFIVEGEKCAYALQTLGFQVVTSLGGSNSADKADWSILDGIKILYLLPDNDEAGFKYMQTIYQALKKLDSKPKVSLCKLPNLPEKGDVCDYLASLPELGGWNELDSLAEHEKVVEINADFKELVGSIVEEVPASWKFTVSKSKHKLILVNDFHKMKLPKRETVLAPWLAEGSINMVFADRGIGKTFFCLSCAVALANGAEFLGYKASKPVSVLYLDGEMQAYAMQARLCQLTHGEPTKAPLSIFTPDCQDLTDHIPDVGCSKGRLEINELVEMADPKVIFIDNISTFIRTGNENEGDSWSPVQEWAVQMRKQGRAIVFIHHANKEGKQRGSHKKEDVMDVVIQLKRPDDYLQGTDATRMLIRYTKARHLCAEDTQDIEATLKTVDGKLEWAWEAGDLTYLRVVELLKDKSMSMAEIADEFGVSKSTIHRWKQKAISENRL